MDGSQRTFLTEQDPCCDTWRCVGNNAWFDQPVGKDPKHTPTYLWFFGDQPHEVFPLEFTDHAISQSHGRCCSRSVGYECQLAEIVAACDLVSDVAFNIGLKGQSTRSHQVHGVPALPFVEQDGSTGNELPLDPLGDRRTLFFGEMAKKCRSCE